MNGITRTIVGVTATSAIAIGAGAMAAPAQAYGTPGCATRTEYQRIHSGMTLVQVQHVTAADGHRTYSYISPGYSHITQEFRICGASRWSSMDVELYRYDRTGFHVEDKGWYRF